jgi:hypothetical protein
VSQSRPFGLSHSFVSARASFMSSSVQRELLANREKPKRKA